ncbi:MAG: MBL fold metallo-hydrolase [Kordiimonadaceae bacterium]|nr:MBL fold metallo-hydrolase [Kordiimonadaceae bacterium]
MTKFKPMVSAAIACLCLGNIGSASAADLTLCHIANAGFFAEASGQAVVIDAVLKRDDYDGSFALPSAQTLQTLQNGTHTFSNVKLALVSHLHGDHFDAKATLHHLKSNPKVAYVMPSSAYDLLIAAGLPEAHKDRVHAIMPDEENSPKKLEINGISLTIFRIDHGPNMPQNLGYKVTLAGKTVFHTGDINASAEQLSAAGLSNTATDIMLMPFWYVLQQTETIKKAWDIKTMVPMHYHAKEQPWMARLGGPEGLRTATAALWPTALRIDKEMQCETIK